MVGEKEEKQRHQRQYPGYRYQPRRAGKPNGLRPISSSSTDDSVRCPKCNGRYISTPNTPLTPFTPAFGTGPRNERLVPSTSSRTREIEVPMYAGQMQNTRMDTPRLPPHPPTHRRAQYSPPQPLQTHRERDEEMDLLSPSPGQKRRRFNEEKQRGFAENSPVSYSGTQPLSRTGVAQMSAGYRQTPLPGPTMMARPGTMGPPPQHSPMNQQLRHQYPTRSSLFDESLRLPPLQTQLPSSNPTSQRPDVRLEAREIQAKSIEAMVMTIPYINKIKVLGKIAPPLAPPGPTSPAQDIRGAVIAVEGPDKDTMAEVGAFIKEHLSKDPSCNVRTWAISAPKLAAPQTRDAEMANATIPTPMLMESEEKDQFVDYLAIISEWHKKSLEMTRYITTTTDSSAAETNGGIIPATKGQLLQVALVPYGFSLSTSDTFALRIPINDSYAPVDHWQWMATLWRGIVGPDLTIYVNKVGREEMDKMGGVEIRGDCAAIIVRILEGAKMDEKTARRLGFEVVEFVRNIENAFGKN
jgi:HMG box factor